MILRANLSDSIQPMLAIEYMRLYTLFTIQHLTTWQQISYNIASLPQKQWQIWLTSWPGPHTYKQGGLIEMKSSANKTKVVTLDCYLDLFRLVFSGCHVTVNHLNLILLSCARFLKMYFTHCLVQQILYIARRSKWWAIKKVKQQQHPTK